MNNPLHGNAAIIGGGEDTCEKTALSKNCTSRHGDHLQDLQDDELQDEHPEPPDVTGFSTPLIPNRENFLVIFPEPHFGHVTSGFDPETSFSNSSGHSLHLYS